MKIIGSLFLLLFLIICPQFIPAQNAYSLDELSQFTKVERLSERVIIVRNGVTDIDGVTAIATQKGIVVIDAGTNTPRTMKYREIIEKEFKRNDFVYLIQTHSHYDHTFGNRAFKEAVVIGHKNIEKELSKNFKEKYYETYFANSVENWKNRLQNLDTNSNQSKQLRIYLYEAGEILSNIKNKIMPFLPAISFDDEMTLDMGDVTFQLKYFGKSHTESDILVYVPEEQLLFVGDLFNYPGDVNFDFYGKENAENWVAALNTLIKPENEIKYVVNGHFSRTMGKDVLLDFYNNMNSFLNGYNEGKEFYSAGMLGETFEKNGAEGLLNEINKLQKPRKAKYFYLENSLKGFAYSLLGAQKIKEAIAVFQFITQQFPGSWNAFDSYAEANMVAGNTELAIKNYEKSLELNPQNTNAVEQLKKLKTK